MKITADSLVTGGTGFLGRWLVATLTAQGRQVAVVARGGANRAPQLAAFVDSHGGDASKLVVVDGDLTAPGLGIDNTIEGVRDVYHLAAAFAFGMKATRAREINVGGTLRVATWALAQPSLRRFVHLGGYRSTVLPDWLTTAPFPLSAKLQRRLYRQHGAYEASKLESHLALRQFAADRDLPVTWVHPSTVIGSSVTGESSQTIGIGDTIEKMWRGKLPALAGSARTFVPLISVDYLAQFMASVPTREQTRGQELCVLDQRTPRLPELVASIANHLGVKSPTRIISKGVVARLPTMLTGVERETLTFLTDDEYDTRSAEAHARAVELTMPDIEQTAHRWATYLVSSRFGHIVDPEPAQFAAIAGSRTYTVGDASTADSILLHGLPWDERSGRDLAEALDETTARPDLPGMGRSSSVTTPHDAWLTALLADRREPATLIAHSLSTGIALRYAAKHPDRVRELVLISPFFLQDRAPWYLRFAPIAKRLLRVGDAAAMQRRLIGTRPGLHPAIRSAHEHLARPGVAKHIARALAVASTNRERAELRNALRDCGTPALIVHGERDPLIVSAHDVPTVTCADAGHSPHVEQPVAVAHAIATWRDARTMRLALA